MITTSDTIGKLAEALSKAQAVMTGAVRDGDNPHFKSEYPTLKSAVSAARGPLTDNGLSFVQMPGAMTEGGLPVTTRLMHSSGEWLQSTFTMPLVKRDPQGVGSALTYACRYALMATLGLPPVDDDGESAMGREPVKAAPAKPIRKPADDTEAARAFVTALQMAESLTDLAEWQAENLEAIQRMSGPARDMIRDALREHRALLTPTDEKEAA